MSVDDRVCDPELHWLSPTILLLYSMPLLRAASGAPDLKHPIRCVQKEVWLLGSWCILPTVVSQNALTIAAPYSGPTGLTPPLTCTLISPLKIIALYVLTRVPDSQALSAHCEWATMSDVIFNFQVKSALDVVQQTGT